MSENGHQKIIDKVSWMARRGYVSEMVRAEMLEQDCTHGENRQVPDGEWFKWIIEELGEASRGIQDGDLENAQYELVQAAALCIQFASTIVVDDGCKKDSSIPVSKSKK